LAVVIAAQPGQTLKCYACTGFIESSPEHPMLNVKGCGDDPIPADSKITTIEAGGDNMACTITSYQNKDWNDGTRVAIRTAMPKGNAEGIEAMKKTLWTAIHPLDKNAKEDDIKVEQCQTDLCSGAAGTTTTTVATTTTSTTTTY